MYIPKELAHKVYNGTLTDVLSTQILLYGRFTNVQLYLVTATAARYSEAHSKPCQT